MCRKREDLGPDALAIAKTIPLDKEQGGTLWLQAGLDARIGVPRNVVEAIQARRKQKENAHTEVKLQHHIPVWLSSGFATPAERDGRLHIWRGGSEEAKSHGGSPNGWGAIGRFYNREQGTLEEVLAEYDGRDAATAKELRTNGVKAVTKEIPGLLTRLVLRRATTREMIENTLAEIEAGAELRHREEVVEPGKIKREWLHRIRQGARGIREVVEAELREIGIEEADLDEAVGTWMQKAAAQAEHVDTELFKAGSKLAVSSVVEKTLGGAKEHHLDWLEATLEEQSALEKYGKGMGYCVLECSEPILVLGDSVVVEARVGEGKAYDPLEDMDKEIESVYLPLTPTLLLVGKRKESERRELGWILAACARLARCSFITGEEEHEIARGEQKLIGNWREGIDIQRGYEIARQCREERDK